MTIREKMEQLLVDHGMWPDEAKTVIETVEASGNQKPMTGRWDNSTDGYPHQLLSILWLSVKIAGVEWIDENKPQHFARGILSA